MCRRNVPLLAVVCLLVGPHLVHGSVIIKTAPHANVKMEFGAQHVPPHHDVALLDESAKVDGTTHLGIEVPHSHNHRNVLIHKIGTYLTVVMKALAKTVAPTQNQDGKTHFDIHVDADLGENDSKDKKDESAQFTIVHSKHGEGEQQGKGDCVKAVVIVSDSENDGKKEQHKSSEKHHHDGHKKKEDTHIHLHISSEESKDESSHSKHDTHHQHHQLGGKVHISKEKKEEKKEDSHEDLKLEAKLNISKEKKEHKKEDSHESFKLQPPKDWESFKKTQAMLKEQGFILQLDKSFFSSKDSQSKQSHKVQSLDVKKETKISHEGKSLSEEDMDASERDMRSLELTEADPEEMWISAVNPTDLNGGYKPLHQSEEKPLENNSFSKNEAMHVSTADDTSKASKQIQTIKTTAYQTGNGPLIVTTTKSLTEMPPASTKSTNYEVVKQTSVSEKLNPTKPDLDQHQLSLSANEIPSIVSSHFQQTSYSSDRSRSMTIVTQAPAFDPSKSVLPQPVVFQVKDKLSEKVEPSKKMSQMKTDDESGEVIMRLAPVSKAAANKKAQTVEVKKVKITKPDTSDESHKSDLDTDGTATRQESIRKLPMANIPTLIDVLQNSPPQEVQRLTQLAGAATPEESQKDHSSTKSENTSNSPSLKSAREFQLPELHADGVNSEEQKEFTHSSEIAPASSEVTRNEKSLEYVDETLTHSEGLKTIAKDEVSKENNGRLSSAEESRSLKDFPENSSPLKSMEESIGKESNRNQKELLESSLDTVVQAEHKNAEGTASLETGRNEKSFRDDTKDLHEEQIPQGSTLVGPVAVEEIGSDTHASHTLALSSLTNSVEEARALDISPAGDAGDVPGEVKQIFPPTVEDVAPSPKNLKQDVNAPLKKLGISDIAQKTSEELAVDLSLTSPISPEEKTGHKQASAPNETPIVTKSSEVHNEPKEANPSGVYGALAPEDSTTPSLPEKESIGTPVLKETEQLFADDVNPLLSNLVEPNDEVIADEVDRDARIYDSQLDLNAPLTLPHQHAVVLPGASVTTPATPLNNAIHDPNSPYIYSYYPAFYPKGVYNTQNKTDEPQGLYGRPSPRVICVNTDTGKVLGDMANIEDQSNAIAKYSPGLIKSNKEDDNLMLLKLLHEDIQKLKQQLKIQ